MTAPAALRHTWGRNTQEFSTLTVHRSRKKHVNAYILQVHSFCRILDAPQRRCACGAWRRKATPPKRKAEKVTKRTKKASPGEKKSGDGKIRFLSKWELFSPEAYRTVPAWEVPWGWQTTSVGMIAWGASFLLAGILTIPLGINLLGVTDYKSMTAMQQSQIQLLDQVASTIVGVLLIKFISTRKKDQPPPDDYLKVSPSNAFAFPDGWASWAVLGLLTAPFAIVLSSTVFSLLPQDLSTGRGTIDGVAGLVETVDPVIFVNLLFMSGVLAPILEETVFRGFLLTSLTKYMSLPASVFVSSLIFAACHFSPRDFPQLLALGMVMGFAYARSRNLLTSIAIHAVWNSTVVIMLFFLVNSGVSMSELLGE